MFLKLFIFLHHCNLTNNKVNPKNRIKYICIDFVNKIIFENIKYRY